MGRESTNTQLSNLVDIGEGTLTGDDAGVDFVVDSSGNQIVLWVGLDDASAGTMIYNIERTMI